MNQSTIRAFQNILTTYKFDEPKSFPEDFAQKRYLKKMEVPDEAKRSDRKQKCFTDWATFDESLKLPSLLPGNWYKARLLIHQWCDNFRLGPIAFTNGSEAAPTHGFNSIESKLMRSKWECTVDCFDLWAETAYETLAIRRALRARISAVMKHDQTAVKAFYKSSYQMFKNHSNFKFLCFKRSLAQVTFIRDASRFSTVRKNNEKDRPIDLQPLCNMLVQRRVGNGLRDLLKGQGVDLDYLADSHRVMIKNRSFATIDLKNASDSIHIDLIRFLFPRKVFQFIEKSRTQFTEGLDGQYYLTKKVSAMGNGFTFELMTVVIRALGLQFSSLFSVFGDDIIIPNEHARQLITDLCAVGFIVNDDKSFIDSPFRESCGGNYHDDYGYVESFDFEYPLTIHDCVVLNNKAYVLSRVYPSFKRMFQLLSRAVPKALQGPARVLSEPEDGRQGYIPQINLSSTFWATRVSGEDWSDSHVRRVLRSLCYDPNDFKLIYGFQYKPKEASRRVKSLQMRRHTGKYFMYLQSGCITPDVIEGRGSWQQVAYLTDGRNLFRFRLLKDVELPAV
ncbi:MAG: RNA replicase beta chain [Sanya duin-like virus 1]|nr:MAG: RNA replicase beta chain [Sanya duin-like virus 1]